jgi:hypothetical protein
MKRLWASVMAAMLVLVWGCGYATYEYRLNQTLEDLKYRQRLDDNLIPAPADAKFKEFPMYIRPPKGMALSREFVMAELPAGQYDLSATFFEQGKGTLHVLGRRKTAAKKATGKNAPQQPEPAAPRGPFVQDVTTLLQSVYGANEKLQDPQFQNDTTKKTALKRLIFDASNGDVIRVYLYQKDPYDVALIWDIPAAADRDTKLIGARDLCLQSFAVGRRANDSFAGSLSSSETGGEAGAAGGGAGAETPTPF